MMKISKYFLAAIALALSGFASISCELVTLSEPTAQSRLDELKKEIMEEVGEARAENVGQCQTTAFGSKPCGGPWTYLVYSTKTTNETRLYELIEEYNALEDELNRKEGRVSDCMFVVEPEIALEGGVCVPLPRGSDLD